jgi:hypothetical protein
MPENSKLEKFHRDGYTVVRSLFSRKEIEFYKKQLDEQSLGRKEKWTLPDGVCQYPAFWDIIFNEKILVNVRDLFGGEVKFLQHNDLHVGFSSFTWHRDNVCRDFGVGPDWDESTEPYQLARVGIYLQESQGGFRLGLIPGTHRPDRWLSPKDHQEIERQLSGTSKIFNTLTFKDPLEDKAHWIATEPGDCVIFDPRTVHTGSEFKGTKYSFFIAYGIENQHFKNHYNYYRHLRNDLSYQALHPNLVQRLQEAGLYAGETAASGKIEGAWLPSKAFQMVAKHFK